MPVRLHDIARKIREEFSDAVTDVDDVRDHIVVTKKVDTGGEVITRKQIDDDLHMEKLRKLFAR